MPNNSGDSFAESLYRKMSDDELQNTLRCEMFSEGALDNTQFEMILAEMERRRINEPTRSPEDAWAEFESDYSGRESAYRDFAAASVPPEKALHADKPVSYTHLTLPTNKQRRKRCSKRKAILLAAVICVLLTSLLTVQAAGIDVFGAIARWTTDLFSFGKTEERRGLVVDGKWPEIDEEQNLQFASLQDALDFYGVTEVEVPQWIPPEFTQEAIAVEQNGVWLAFFAEYVNSGNGVFIISYSSCATVPPTYYEKTDNLLETFNAGGNTYRILQNVDNYVVVWLTPHFECCISMSADSTDISSLKNIILSMQ